MIGRLVLAIAVMACISAPAGAQQGEPLALQQFPEIHRLLASNDKAKSAWNSCPADIFRSEKGFWTGVVENPDFESADCEKDPHSCYRHCFEARNENACFSLARALQDNTERKFSRYWETMFAVACATGSAGGCTNRGAGIRNGLYEDDPFTSKSTEIRDGCLFRTFEATCLAEDPWGCTMRGMTFQYGEGVQADLEVAKEYYRRACALAPDFPACETAEEQIAEME